MKVPPKKQGKKKVCFTAIGSSYIVFNPVVQKRHRFIPDFPHEPHGSSHAWISKTVEKLEKARKINKNIPLSNLTKGGVVQLCTPFFVV